MAKRKPKSSSKSGGEKAEPTSVRTASPEPLPGGEPPVAGARSDASQLIDRKIRELGGWRGATLARMRALILEAAPGTTEELKWMGTPVWSHDGIVCTGESYTKVVKFTFAQGASLPDPSRLFNSSLDGNTRRAIDLHEGEEIDADAFQALIQAAVARNASFKKKSKPAVGKAKPAAKKAAAETTPSEPAASKGRLAAGAKRNVEKAEPAAKKANPASKKGERAAIQPESATGEAKQVKLLSGGNPQIAKADGDAPVQAYIAAMPGWKREIGERFDAIVTQAVPGVRKAVKWNSPLYGVEGQGWFLSFHVLTRYVKATFFNGLSLTPVPPGGTEKSRESRWLDVYEDDAFDEALFTSWVKQAAALPGWKP